MKQFMVIEIYGNRNIFPGLQGTCIRAFSAAGHNVAGRFVLIDSWLMQNGAQCFQLMQTDDVTDASALLKENQSLV